MHWERLKFVGAPHIDFLHCKKLLLPGVTLHWRLHRSSSDFSLQSVADSDVLEKASKFLTKLTLRDSVRQPIEKTLINEPAHYTYLEMTNKNFIQAGQKSFVKECFWNRSPDTTNAMHGNQWAVPWDKGYWRFSLSTIWAATAGNYTSKWSSNSRNTAGCAEWKDESLLQNNLFTWFSSGLHSNEWKCIQKLWGLLGFGVRSNIHERSVKELIVVYWAHGS